MKKFILSLFFVIFALFNVCGEDLLHPVIRDDIDEDVKKIELALVDYVFYPEMVERGFDVHQLDNMKIDGEMFEYIESFFRPNDEKGWVALDNHHVFSIKDKNGKWHPTFGIKIDDTFINFSFSAWHSDLSLAKNNYMVRDITCINETEQEKQAITDAITKAYSYLSPNESIKSSNSSNFPNSNKSLYFCILILKSFFFFYCLFKSFLFLLIYLL